MQEAHVVLEVEAQILNAKLQHSDTLNTHTKGEATILSAIYAVGLQHVGVNHTATHNLQPAGALTYVTALATAQVTRHIHLSTRLGEREVTRAHTNLRALAKQLLSKVQQRLFQVGKRYTLVDIQALNLVENTVRPIRDSLVSEHSAGADNADRGLLVLHSAHLDRAGVRSEQDIGVLLNEEGVLHIPRRVLRREVQRREDVPVILHLRALSNSVTQPREDIDNLPANKRDGVARANTILTARTCHITNSSRRCLCSISSHLLQCINTRSGSSLNQVNLLTQLPLLLRSNLLELLQNVVQLTLATKNLDTKILNLRRISGVETLNAR